MFVFVRSGLRNGADLTSCSIQKTILFSSAQVCGMGLIKDRTPNALAFQFSSAQVCGMGLISMQSHIMPDNCFRPLRFAEWG